MSKNYVKEYKGHKVPEGATHYNESINCFYGEFDGVWLIRHANRKCSEEGWSAITHQHMQEAAIELQEEPTQEWVDGLPPLNSEVLLSDEEGHLFSSASNEKVSIAEDEVLVVVSIGARYDNGNPVVTLMTKDSKNLQGFVTVNPEFLEPVKTQEQKDREAFVDAGIISYMESESNAVKDRDLELLLERMFSDGFKAPEGE